MLGGFVVLILLIGALGGGNSSSPTAASSGSPASTVPSAAPAETTTSAAPTTTTGTGEVVYQVLGSGSANNITFGALGGGGLSQQNGESLPWSQTEPFAGGFDSFSLTAQNNGSGEITCVITVDGQEIARKTSSGQYAVVSCGGTSSMF